MMTSNTVGGRSGNSPVARQADSTLSGVKAAFQAGQKSVQNTHLDMPMRLKLVCISVFKFLEYDVDNGLKRPMSRGCKRCVE